MSPLWTAAEIMAVAIARLLRDGETIAVGSVSPIPASACLLAQQRQAPHARLILLGSAEHFPFDGGMQEFYNFAVRGRLDVFFASGAQIDERGNFNLSVIGDAQRPTVRLPGGRAVYEHLHPGLEPDHLSCRACGRIVEFVSPGISALLVEICRAHDFAPREPQLQIVGLCRACAARGEKRVAHG